MTMPIDLVLVRHGQSEGNLASKASKKGDDSHFTEEFRNRHSASWRLTDKGIAQAQVAGAWIKQNMGHYFDRYYTSEYLRAMETAIYLNMPRAQWMVDFYLRERDWGDMDIQPNSERRERFSEALRKKEIDSFFWNPPNGESMATLCLRVDRVLDTLHRECVDKRVLIVCHGEVMWGFRVRLERLSQERFIELDCSDHPFDHIHNGQIIHYTRRNPDTLQLQPSFGWVRSVCPTDLTLSSNNLVEIQRKRYTNEDLIERVGRTERMISG